MAASESVCVEGAVVRDPVWVSVCFELCEVDCDWSIRELPACFKGDAFVRQICESRYRALLAMGFFAWGKVVVSIHYIRRYTEFILLRCFDAQCGPSLTNIDLPQSHLCWRSDKDRAVELGDSRVEINLVLHFGMFGGVVEGIFRHCRGDVATNTDYNCVSRGCT